MKTSEQATKSQHIYRDARESSTRMQIAHISHRSDAPTHTHTRTLDASVNDSRPPNDAVWNGFLWVFILVSTHRHDNYHFFSSTILHRTRCLYRVGVIFTTRFQTTQQRIFWICLFLFWRCRCGAWNGSRNTIQVNKNLIEIIRCCSFYSGHWLSANDPMAHRNSVRLRLPRIFSVSLRTWNTHTYVQVCCNVIYLHRFRCLRWRSTARWAAASLSSDRLTFSADKTFWFDFLFYL